MSPIGFGPPTDTNSTGGRVWQVSVYGKQLRANRIQQDYMHVILKEKHIVTVTVFKNYVHKQHSSYSLSL